MNHPGHSSVLNGLLGGTDIIVVGQGRGPRGEVVTLSGGQCVALAVALTGTIPWQDAIAL